MKKIIFIISFMLLFTSLAAMADSAMPYGMDILDDEVFFESPLNNVSPNVRVKNSETSEYDDEMSGGYDDINKFHNKNIDPFFKSCRVKLTNKYRRWNYKHDLEQYQKEQTQLSGNSEDMSENQSGNTKRINLKFWQKKTQQNSINLSDNAITNSINEEVDSKQQDPNTLSFSTGISDEETQKELILDAEDVNFDEETGDVIATGRPEMEFPTQNTKIIADKITYNQISNIIKGIGNVIIIKDGVPSHSDYVEIDTNEETSMADNVQAMSNFEMITAKHATQKDAVLTFTDGYIHSDQSNVYKMSTSMIGPNFRGLIIDDEDKASFWENPKVAPLHFDVDSIYITGAKNHDVIKAKGIKLVYKDKQVLKWPSITAYTDKQHQNFEANYPEFGTKSKLGMFIGPGVAFGGPFGSVMKVIPFLNYNHNKFGFGGALKYRNVFNETDIAYGTAANIFYLHGFQRLDDHLYLQYASNAYTSQWFMGSRMPKYAIEAFYDRGYRIPDFLAKNKDLSFRHRASFGLMKDNDTNSYGEHYKGNSITTTRLRYMAQIKQSLYHYERPEDRFYFDFSAILQGSAAVYGTGATQFIAEIGPRVHVQYKNWMQDITYYQTGFSDDTPLKRFDRYRYGSSSLAISEILRLNKYLSLGWMGRICFSNDSGTDRLFQESRFAIAIGPDDMRMRIGYDIIRKTSYVGFDFAFDTKGTSVNFGKMVIKNPELVGKQRNKTEKEVLFEAPAIVADEQNKLSSFLLKKNEKINKKELQYAQVINIQDPDKETIE